MHIHKHWLHKKIALSALIAGGLFATAPQAHAADATWDGDTSALWSTGGNWSATPVPGAGNTATFNSAGGAVDTIDLTGGVTIRNIAFDTNSAAAYTIGTGLANSQAMTLENDGSITLSNTVANNQLFNATINLGTATAGIYTITNNSANNLTFAGTLQGGTGGTASGKTLNLGGTGNMSFARITRGGASTDGVTLSKTGDGTVTLGGTLDNLSAALMLNGGLVVLDKASAFNVQAIVNNSTITSGTLRLAGTGGNQISNNADLTINGGTFDLNGRNETLRVLLGSGGTVTNSNAAPSIFTVGSGTGTYSGNIVNGTGTVALTKTGSGTQSLNGTNTYSGATAVNSGTLVYLTTSAKSGSSTTTVAASATLGLGVGGSGTFTSADIDSLIAGTLSMVSMNATAIAGIDTSAGSFTYPTVIAGSRSIRKLGGNTLTLSGSSSSYSGTFTVAGGTLSLTGGMNTLGTAANLSQSGTSTVDLGGVSQTFANYTAPNQGSAQTATLTNGSLVLSGGASDVSFTNSSSNSTVDMSALSAFTFNQSTKLFRVFGGYTGANDADRSTVTVLLPGASATNGITAQSVRIGYDASPGVAVTSGNTSVLRLGQSNTINTNGIYIATERNNSTLSFNTGLTNPTTTIRGLLGGTTRVPTVTIATGFGTNTGTMDFSLGSVDARIGTLNLAQNSSSGSGSSGVVTTNGNLLVSAGTIDATTIIMANQTGQITSGGAIINATLTQSGGTIVVGSLQFGAYNGLALPISDLRPTYILAGGTLNAQWILAGPGGSSTSVRKIDWSGGTIRNFNDGVNPAADLTIFGAGSAAKDVLSINLLTTGANSHTFLADPGRTITVAGTAPITGDGGIIKSGAGTLLLAGANNYTGVTTVSDGKLVVNGSIASDTVVSASGKLGGSGTIGGTITVNGGTLSPGSSVESLAAGSNIWKGPMGFDFEFKTDGTGMAAGNDWDLLAITGSLDLSDVAVGGVDFNLVTMASASMPGVLASWDPNVNHTWAGFVTTTMGITDFASNKFSIDVTGFQNIPLNGTFSVVQNGNNLDLQYSVIPEPSTLVLGGLALLGFAGVGLRKRRLAKTQE